MLVSRQKIISFLIRLNGYYCKENKGSYGPQFLEVNSYKASHIDNSIPRKEKDPGSFTLPCYINNVCFDNAIADLGASVSVMPLSTYLNLGLGKFAHTKLTVEIVDRIVKYPKGIAKNVLVGIGKFLFLVDFIFLDMPEDVKVPLILERPFLSTPHAKIDVFKRKITLRVRDEKIIFKSVKPASSLIKRVRELIEIRKLLSKRALREFERLPKKLLGPLALLYTPLNHSPSIPSMIGSLVLAVRSFVDTRGLPSCHSLIVTACATYNLGVRKSSCRWFIDMWYPQGGELKSGSGELHVVKNMDGYRDQDMGDIILGEPFCKASRVKERRFDGLITIHNGNDNVTYQMARSHPRFKHLSNAQCNKIKPLLKVSMHDKLNGISHPYQKLKSFYKGVLNLGPEYVQDAKIEEWLTCGHVSMHEME
ncbi:gag-pol polyprotein [Tanacetum coccineum]